MKILIILMIIIITFTSIKITTYKTLFHKSQNKLTKFKSKIKIKSKNKIKIKNNLKAKNMTKTHISTEINLQTNSLKTKIKIKIINSKSKISNS